MRRSIGLILLCVMALGACSSPVISGVRVRQGVLHSFYRYAATNKHLLVTVKGRLFGATEEQTATKLVAQLPAPLWVGPTSYTTDKAQADHPSFRIAVLVNPTGSQSAVGLCQDRVQGEGGDGTGPSPTILMAFCSDGDPIARASGTISEVTGFDDPKFQDLLSGIISALLPLEKSTDSLCKRTNGVCG